MGKFAKFWSVVSVGGLAWVASVVASKPSGITSHEWYEALAVAVAAVTVFIVPNAPQSTV